jgi:hypothetical protein
MSADMDGTKEGAAMFGKHKFKVGQRVRPSTKGIEANLFRGEKKQQGSGVVTKVDEYNSPTVLWDWRRTEDGYHPDFIAPDRRRRRL